MMELFLFQIFKLTANGQCGQIGQHVITPVAVMSQPELETALILKHSIMDIRITALTRKLLHVQRIILFPHAKIHAL